MDAETKAPAPAATGGGREDEAQAALDHEDSTEAQQLLRAFDEGYVAGLLAAGGVTEHFELGARPRRFDTIEPESIAWLWPNRLPVGKVSMLVGDPGLGKSLLTLALAAAVSRGARWPIEAEGTAPLGDAMIISAEDDAADTIRPRLEAAGADLARCYILDGLTDIDDDGRPFRRPWTVHDLDALTDALLSLPSCRLVVIDPISAFLPGTDSHRNTDVRAVLAPLTELAARHRVAVVLVSHLTKGSGPAIYRTTGSLAFVAAARAAYAVSKDPEDDARRLVVPVKANLAPDTGGLAYRITGGDPAPALEWEDTIVDVDADEALTREDEHARDARSQREEAEEWLLGRLANGPVRVRDLQAEAKADGIHAKTLQRARRAVGAVAEREDFGGAYRWHLPGPAGHAGHPPGDAAVQQSVQHAETRIPKRFPGGSDPHAGPLDSPVQHDQQGQPEGDTTDSITEQILAEACAGTNCAPTQLREALAPEDLSDLDHGERPIEALRHLAGRLGGSP